MLLNAIYPFIGLHPNPPKGLSMVPCQFQALRAETERLRAADVAATLLLSEKEEAKHGGYDGLSIKHCDFKRQVLEGTSTHSMGLT